MKSCLGKFRPCSKLKAAFECGICGRTKNALKRTRIIVFGRIRSYDICQPCTLHAVVWERGR
jgi:Ni,Fe-hydrogenase I large subunit